MYLVGMIKEEMSRKFREFILGEMSQEKIPGDRDQELGGAYIGQ